MPAVTAIVLVLLFVSSTARGEGCSVGPQVGEPPPERQFDFLLGEHEIALHAWQGDRWSPPRPEGARWRGWLGLGDQAIYDEWHDPHPDQGGSGINVRLYDSDEAAWKMMWVSTRTKQVQDLRAEDRDGVLTMWQVYPSRPGWRAEFTVLSDVQWARTEYLQEDGVWVPRFRLVATRVACD